MSLKLVIDGRPLVGERTGIGVHTAEIAARLDGVVEPVIATHAAIADLDGIEEIRRRVDPMPLGLLWQQLVLPTVTEREGADVVWGPHGTVPLLLKRPAVVSVHDLTSITMPRAHKLRTILSFNPLIGQSLARAVKIMSVSQFTADQVIRGFAIDPGKVEVVPNGVSEYFSPAPNVETGEPNILYAGSIEPRKGIGDLVDAWQRLPGRPRLILAGSRGWKSGELFRRINRWVETGEVVVAGFVDRERLRDLYRRATLFVYPSHFEGFGLPVLEAMACGTPVITTTGGAIPEAAGNAAATIEPGDVVGLSKAMKRILASEEVRRDMRARGLEHVKAFSWAQSARHASEIIRHAAEHGR